MNAPQQSLRYKNLAALSAISACSLGLEPLAELIDSMILGQKHGPWLAAMAYVNTLLGTSVWVFNFLSYGVASRLAQAVGRGDRTAISARLITTTGLALGIGVSLGVALHYLSPWLLQEVLGASNSEFETGRGYLAVRLLGLPFALAASTLLGALRGLHQIKITVYVLTMSTTVNAVGSLCLVHLANTGMIGAGIATVGAYVGSSIFMAEWLRRRGYWTFSSVKNIDVLGSWDASLGSIGRDARWLFLRSAFLTGSFFVALSSLTGQDTPAIAAHQVGLQLWLLAAYLLDGVALTATTIGGALHGRRKTRATRILDRRIGILGGGVGTVFGLGYGALWTYIPAAFTSDTRVWQELALIAPFVIVTQPVNGVVFALDGVLLRRGDFKMMASCIVGCAVCCYLPTLAWSVWSGTGLAGVWLAFTLFNVGRAVWSGIIVFGWSRIGSC